MTWSGLPVISASGAAELAVEKASGAAGWCDVCKGWQEAGFSQRN